MNAIDIGALPKIYFKRFLGGSPSSIKLIQLKIQAKNVLKH